MGSLVKLGPGADRTQQNTELRTRNRHHGLQNTRLRHCPPPPVPRRHRLQHPMSPVQLIRQLPLRRPMTTRTTATKTTATTETTTTATAETTTLAITNTATTNSE